MFRYGEDVYNFEFRNTNPSTGQQTKKKSAIQFYGHRLMVRNKETNYLLLFGHLINQLIVDMFAKIECEQLLYIYTHQSPLRKENCIHLMNVRR